MEKDLSVIIVGYNSLQYVSKCLKSIEEYNDIGEKLEVIVVDNSPGDETYNWIRLNYPNVDAIKNSNKGFGQANNEGVKRSHGQYLLFLNPDTELVEPIFGYARSKFHNNEKLGAFGFKLIQKDGKKTNTFGLRMPLGLQRTIICNILTKLNIFIPRYMYTSGADLFVRKKAFVECGGFDENIFMYCEEADILNRINKVGYTNGLFLSHKLIHHEGKTDNLSLYNRYIKEMKSREYYCRKYGYNFQHEIKKELKYCIIKKYIFSIIKNKERSAEYSRIVEYWQAIIRKESRD